MGRVGREKESAATKRNGCDWQPLPSKNPSNQKQGARTCACIHTYHRGVIWVRYQWIIWVTVRGRNVPDDGFGHSVRRHPAKR